MKTPQLILALAALLVGGCATQTGQMATEKSTGTLALDISYGSEANEREARVYIDGRFVGHYGSDQMTLQLPAGNHTVVVEMPAYRRVKLPDGSVQGHSFKLTGEEHIEVFPGSVQPLVFSSSNLQRHEVDE